MVTDFSKKYHILDYCPTGIKDPDNSTLKSIVREERTKLFDAGIYYPNPAFPNNLKIIDKEFDTIAMLESCYAYRGIGAQSHTVLGFDKYYEKYLEEYLDLGGKKEDLDKLIAVQTEYLRTCCYVYHGVAVDPEGLSYNGIRFGEPPQEPVIEEDDISFDRE